MPAAPPRTIPIPRKTFEVPTARSISHPIAPQTAMAEANVAVIAHPVPMPLHASLRLGSAMSGQVYPWPVPAVKARFRWSGAVFGGGGPAAFGKFLEILYGRLRFP